MPNTAFDWKEVSFCSNLTVL